MDPIELNSLPDLCLLLILEFFSVNEQAQFRAVCTQWKGLVVRLWRSVKIIIIEYHGHNNKYVIGFDNNSQVSCSIDSGLERFVTSENFPGVTCLNLNFSDEKKCAEKLILPHCLTQWTATLIELTFHFPAAYSPEYQSTLWSQVDSLKSLRVLYLHLNCANITTKMLENFRNYRVFGIDFEEESIVWKVPVNLSILANLKTFTLVDYDTALSDDNGNDEIGALTQLGPNLRLLSLHTLTSASIQSFRSIAPKLTSLLELVLNIPKFAQPYLLDLLTSLAQLKQLRNVYFVYIDWDQFTSLTTHHEYPKLTSVKYLNMKFANKHKPTNPGQHMDQFNQHFFTCIPIMFPSLTKIDVEMHGLEDQPFVDMIEVKMKRKFVALSDIKFRLIRYSN